MKVTEFYQRLSKTTQPATVTLAPGPYRVKVTAHDGLAGELLLWLHDRLPEGATHGDLEDVLDAAKWWFTFWVAQDDEDDNALLERLILGNEALPA